MIYDVYIKQLELLCVFDIKGSHADVFSYIKELSIEAPENPNSATKSGTYTLGWVGQDHWLLLAPQSQEQFLISLFDNPQAIERNISAIEVSDMLQFFSIEGSDVEDILAICSPFDTHRSAFPKNGFTYTNIFDTKALVLRSTNGFQVGADRSYADYINDNLHRAAGQPLNINHAGQPARVAKNAF